MKRRAGKFSIANEFLSEHFTAVLFEIFKQLQFVPYRAEYRYMHRSLECEGLSPLFEEIDDTVVSPEYKILIDRVDNGSSDEVVILNQPFLAIACLALMKRLRNT